MNLLKDEVDNIGKFYVSEESSKSFYILIIPAYFFKVYC
jgi:hypothetical protein